MESSRRRSRRRAIAAIAVVVVFATAACGRSAEQRRLSIYDLQKSGSAGDVEAIRAFLDDADGDVRATALHALVGLGVPDAADLALERLDDPEPLVRQIAARALGEVGAPGVVAPLGRRVLEDESFRVREKATEALTRLGGEDAVAILVEALRDPAKEVRLAAVRGLVRLDLQAGVDEFVAMVLDDPEWEVRVQVAAALGKSGREDVRPILERAAEDPNEFVRAAVEGALRARD